MDTSKYEREALKELKYFNSLIPEKVYKVYSAAVKYYGEDRVQLDVGFENYNQSILRNNRPIQIQDPQVEDIEFPALRTTNDTFLTLYSVIIYFPEVTVTNEANKSTVIKDLFARIPLLKSGRMAVPFRLTRATYTGAELMIGYMHSHCHSLNSNNPENWDTPCLGTGPLKTTVYLLMREYDELRWGLFFWELDKFTQVESLAGIPYLKLQDIGVANDNEFRIDSVNTTVNISEEERNTITKLVKSYLNTDLLKVTEENGHIILGMPFVEWLVEFTKYYMKWKSVAEQLKEPTLDRRLRNYKIRDNILYTNSRGIDWAKKVGTHIINFKGTDFEFTITEERRSEGQIPLLDINLSAFILNQILSYINCGYDTRITQYSPKRENGVLAGKFIRVTV